MTPFVRIGGAERLRAIIDDFVNRCASDKMIGFLFARADTRRIKDKEYEHAAEFLLAGIEYSGRALDKAHGPHRIFGGQFDRRRQILIETLNDHQVPSDIRDSWIAHQDGLRSVILGSENARCD